MPFRTKTLPFYNSYEAKKFLSKLFTQSTSLKLLLSLILIITFNCTALGLMEFKIIVYELVTITVELSGSRVVWGSYDVAMSFAA